MDLKIDIKEKVDELVKKLQEDPALLKNFQSDPVRALEQLTGVDLPEQQLQPIITGIKAKLGAGTEINFQTKEPEGRRDSAGSQT